MGLPGFLGAWIGSTEASRTKKQHALVRMSLQAKPLGLVRKWSLFYLGKGGVTLGAIQVTFFIQPWWFFHERGRKCAQRFDQLWGYGWQHVHKFQGTRSKKRMKNRAKKWFLLYDFYLMDKFQHIFTYYD